MTTTVHYLEKRAGKWLKNRLIGFSGRSEQMQRNSAADRKLLDAISQGKWAMEVINTIHNPPLIRVWNEDNSVCVVEMLSFRDFDKDNFAFLAQSPTMVKYYMERVEELEKELEDTERQRAYWHKACLKQDYKIDEEFHQETLKEIKQLTAQLKAIQEAAKKLHPFKEEILRDIYVTELLEVIGGEADA